MHPWWWRRWRPCRDAFRRRRGGRGIWAEFPGFKGRPGLPPTTASRSGCWSSMNTNGWQTLIGATITRVCCCRCRRRCSCSCSVEMWPIRRRSWAGCSGSVAMWRSSSIATARCRSKRWRLTTLIHGLPRSIEGFLEPAGGRSVARRLGAGAGFCAAPAGCRASRPPVCARASACRSAPVHAGAGESSRSGSRESL